MKCSQCGKDLPDNFEYCDRCGAKLTSPAQYASSAYGAQPGQVPPAPGVPPVYQGQSGQAPQRPPVYNPQSLPPKSEHVSVGQWIGIYCINLIPCVGPLVYLIMLFVWAFGNTASPSLKNFAKAHLIIAAVVIVLTLISLIVFGAFFASLWQDIRNSVDNTSPFGYSYRYNW